MRRLGTVAAIVALIGCGLAVPAQAQASGHGASKNPAKTCEGWFETREREIPPESGKFVDFSAFWVPLQYPGFVEELPVLNKAGCITTLLAGGGGVPVPYDALTTAAVNAQCKYLEDTGAITGYPYRFYGNPAYEAKNRSECVYFLRSFHLGLLPPGPGS